MPPTAAGGTYHGWRVVAAAFLVALVGWGLGFYGPGIYLTALQSRHGWSTTAISSAITLYYLLGATLIVFAGSVFGRFGARRVVGVGALAMGSAVTLVAIAVHPWQVYAAFALMSAGWAAMSGAAINIIVAPWFERRRGLAVSLALNGASAGGIVVAPLLILAINRFGLAAALPGVAGLLLVLLLPTVAIVLRPPHAGERDPADGEPPSSPPGRAGSVAPPWRPVTVLRSRAFQTISLPFALGLTAQVGFLTHQVAYLSPLAGSTAAGWAVSLTTVSAVTGRFLAGFVVDRVDRRLAACGNFCIQAAGTLVLVVQGSEAGLYLGCVLFGLGVGNMISLPGLIVQQEFPKELFARIVSLIVAINQFSFAFGPALLARLQGSEGGYRNALLACLAMQAAAAALVILPVLGRSVRPGRG